MTTIIVASSEPRAGRSLIAAAVAYRLGREGKAVTLARLSGDDSAAPDAAAFAALEGIVSPGTPVDAAAAANLQGDVVVLEAPAGNATAVAKQLGAKVLVVGTPDAPSLDVEPATALGIIFTRVPASSLASVVGRPGVIGVLAEDRALAAPSVADIAAALNATHLSGDGTSLVDGVMIGTVSSDAASPYFGNRARTCVITRFDKTDIQLAALNTDLQCLVLTGGGEPSPYLLDRVVGHRPDVAVLLAQRNTVDSMRTIEPLYGTSRFEGESKLARAVQLLDAAGLVLEF
jgi:hypothetical protein